MKGQFDDPLAWRGAPAPSLAELEALAADAYARLPEHFRSLCEDLVIRVEDFPTDEVSTSMDAETEFDLLGLFQGVGLPFRSASAPAQMPNMIWLYRRPILDYWAEHDETLGRDRHPRAGARDRPPFRPVRRRHGSDRSGGRLNAFRHSDRFALHPSPSDRTQKTDHGQSSPLSKASRRRLRMINVDTDMIIPKQYLKTIKRTGLGQGPVLRAALQRRRQREPGFRAQQAGLSQGQDPGRRRQFRLRLDRASTRPGR